jgi:hypothetical protein
MSVETYVAITARRKRRERLLCFAVLVLLLQELWVRARAFSPGRFRWSLVTITVAAM